jgi:DNA-binding transcriptional MerR regulator
VTQPSELAAVRRGSKSATAFRTIGEVAEDLELPPHVLRFWESKFPQLKPLKRGGGRRYYRPEDIVLLRQIRQCLYRDGYTIRGVQKLLREGGLRPGDGPAAAPDDPAAARRAKAQAAPAVSETARSVLQEARQDLLDARALLLEQLRNGGG